MLKKTYNVKEADIWALYHVYVGICELNSKNVLSQIIVISFTLEQSIKINTLGFGRVSIFHLMTVCFVNNRKYFPFWWWWYLFFTEV